MFSFQGVSPELSNRNLKRKPRGAAEDEGVILSERSAEEVAPVRRNLNSGERNCREAEYQDRERSMETGGNSGGKIGSGVPTVRGNRGEGKGRNRG